MKKNILVAQSGGPTVAINSSLGGVIKGCMELFPESKLFGALNGIEGLLERKIISVSDQIKGDEDIELLQKTPAMALGSCRKMLPGDLEAEEYKKIAKILEEYDIGFVVYIGGNDSMDTVDKLSRYFIKTGSDVKVVGVPKTIDNDLSETDHTPGFGSAAKYVATVISELSSDCAIYTVQAVTIVEIMGRNAGFLTAAAGIPKFLGEDAPALIYFPEIPFSMSGFLRDVKKALSKKNEIIVAVSEGIKNKNGRYISEISKVDEFGHSRLSGTARVLEEVVRNEIGCKVRSIELNTPQRAAAHLSSKTDLTEAFNLGFKATELLKEGKSGVMSVIKRISDKPYKTEYSHCDVCLVANVEKKLPMNFINKEGNFITREAFDYLAPLIEGQVEMEFHRGIPKKFRFDKTQII